MERFLKQLVWKRLGKQQVLKQLVWKRLGKQQVGVGRGYYQCDDQQPFSVVHCVNLSLPSLSLSPCGKEYFL